MISPRPWQFGQVRSMVKKPWEARTLPKPAQVGQETGLEPASAPLPVQASHVTEVGTLICALLATAAPCLHYSDHVVGQGPALRPGLRDACGRHRLETHRCALYPRQ